MGASGGKKGRGRARIVGINITPMVDVVLVLLVIMMVAAKFIVSQSIKIDLPKAASSDGSSSSIAAVTITKDGKLYFNAEAATEPQLIEKLRGVYAGNHEVNLVVTADKASSHGDVMHVIDLARTNGITHFAVNVERRE
jgi:biopolymer transport protein ExbD